MKKIIGYTMLVITILILFCSCTNKTATELSEGEYILKDSDQAAAPYVLLENDNQFVFSYSVLSSYLAVGTYSVDNDKLTLITDDGKNTYVFEITDKAIAFIADESAQMPQYTEETPVKDGDIFVLENQSENVSDSV